MKIKDFDSQTDVVKVKRINKRRDKIELGIIGLLVFLFSQTLTFADYWFLYGILSLYSAIRFGFGLSILVSSYILLLTYVFPSVLNEQFISDMILGQEMTRIQMGTGLL